jgi:hypothetical protein
LNWRKGSLIAGAIAALVGLAIERDAHAAIALVGAAEVCVSTVSTTTSKTATCNKPTGTSDNNVVVAFAFSTANQSSGTPIALTEPAGWTAVREHSLVMNARTNAFGIWYRVASSEGATYSFTGSDGLSNAKAITAIVATFSGVSTGSVLDVAYSSGSHEVTTDQDILGSSNQSNAPDITTATANAWVLTYIGANLDNVLSWTEPSGFTLLDTNINNAQNIGGAYIDAGAAGVETIGNWGFTETGSTTTRGVLATIALRPSTTSIMGYARRRH